MKQCKLPIENEVSKFAANMILKDSYNTQNYINSNIVIENSMRIQFNYSKVWSFEQKYTQLNKYKQKQILGPESIPEIMESFVKTFGSESFKSQKAINTSSKKRLRRQYIKNGKMFENDISFEVLGTSKEL
ncbi:Hypothetical_protein [Hexamita inflata]|uniref:Hypothetical_protein n=1 Tax=Hexamita inflata TaxID=28002 RepID=A0AA86PTU7_9EUKA|nr:Hypothetical protein HINF_LOCUS32503 [Hexamita inflata]